MTLCVSWVVTWLLLLLPLVIENTQATAWVCMVTYWTYAVQAEEVTGHAQFCIALEQLNSKIIEAIKLDLTLAMNKLRCHAHLKFSANQIVDINSLTE